MRLLAALVVLTALSACAPATAFLGSAAGVALGVALSDAAAVATIAGEATTVVRNIETPIPEPLPSPPPAKPKKRKHHHPRPTPAALPVEIATAAPGEPTEAAQTETVLLDATGAQPELTSTPRQSPPESIPEAVGEGGLAAPRDTGEPPFADGGPVPVDDGPKILPAPIMLRPAYLWRWVGLGFVAIVILLIGNEMFLVRPKRRRRRRRRRSY